MTHKQALSYASSSSSVAFSYPFRPFFSVYFLMLSSFARLEGQPPPPSPLHAPTPLIARIIIHRKALNEVMAGFLDVAYV